MTKLFNKIKVGIGLAALAVLFAFNLHHAVVYHYGVLNLNFSQHPQVLAQTNSAGDRCTCGRYCSYQGTFFCDRWCPARCTCGGGSSHESGCPLFDPDSYITTEPCYKDVDTNQDAPRRQNVHVCHPNTTQGDSSTGRGRTFPCAAVQRVNIDDAQRLECSIRSFG